MDNSKVGDDFLCIFPLGSWPNSWSGWKMSWRPLFRSSCYAIFSFAFRTAVLNCNVLLRKVRLSTLAGRRPGMV